MPIQRENVAIAVRDLVATTAFLIDLGLGAPSETFSGTGPDGNPATAATFQKVHGQLKSNGDTGTIAAISSDA